MPDPTALADDRLRAATAALAEHEHLLRARALLEKDVAAEDHRVGQLTIELARERQDVNELMTGVLGFLLSLAATDELEKEKREAAEAEARLVEAIGSRDGLRAQLAAIDQRIGGRRVADLEAGVLAARAAKEQALIASGSPSAFELQDIAIRTESIDIELVPLEDAVAAGTQTAATLAQILATLDRARAGTLDQASARVHEAKGMIGDAQARITGFQRAVDELAMPDDTTRFNRSITDDDRLPFADSWVKKLFGKEDRGARLAEARATIVDKLTRVQDQLGPVRARREELAARRATLIAERDRLLEAR